MRTIDAADAQTRLDELLDEAQQQPIVIRRGDKDVATVVSMASYEHLRAIDVERFLALRREIAEEAVSAGLTPERLAYLVRDKDSPDG
jgi:antitoxin (DNA-binding transcriptional repressor) of toxin-antitoxin stability system